jgi:hypothetical protein
MLLYLVKYEMGGAFSAHGIGEKYMQNFSWET